MRGANTGGPFSANGLSLTDPFFYTLPLPALSLSVSFLPSSGLFIFFFLARGLLDEMVASGSVVRNFYFSPAAERAPSRGRPSHHLSLPFPLPLVEEEEAFKTGLEGHKKREREGLLRFLFPFLGDRLVFLSCLFSWFCPPSGRSLPRILFCVFLGEREKSEMTGKKIVNIPLERMLFQK